ncbi:G-type lectin S-receptor-like serine/threonine-protein kinase [Prunus yedoensis var. nudiflora]|uniref:G-type lectin S-receptor-like serine/threonine-protein kinase n=1 Tax=Prunus yedoensis var. nudiflora TaxID=2094558 RepID=A0A314ZMN6_PRUYE|nr:G-type lectin S-receptor-like serine/threonine-protein kinase [Prunus yedoensis var. nudiflora]
MRCCRFPNSNIKILLGSWAALSRTMRNPMTGGAVLDWGRCFKIIQGVARGLLYLLHDSCLKRLYVYGVCHGREIF